MESQFASPKTRWASHTNSLSDMSLSRDRETAPRRRLNGWHIKCLIILARRSGCSALPTPRPTPTLLARGASNAKWRSGCLAPDCYVESICDWLIRGPLFFAQLATHGGQSTNLRQALNQVLPHRPNGSLGAIGYANLAKNVLDVLFHRFVTDA